MKEVNQNTHFKIFNWKVFQKKFKSYSRTHSSGKHELYYTARLDDENIFILYKNIIRGLTIKLNLTLVYSRILIFQKKNFICFNESPLKLMKNVFCFMLKTIFVLKIFKFLSSLFDHVEKRLDWKRKVNFKIYDVTTWLRNNCHTHVAQYFTK